MCRNSMSENDSNQNPMNNNNNLGLYVFMRATDGRIFDAQTHTHTNTQIRGTTINSFSFPFYHHFSTYLFNESSGGCLEGQMELSEENDIEFKGSSLFVFKRFQPRNVRCAYIIGLMTNNTCYVLPATPRFRRFWWMLLLYTYEPSLSFKWKEINGLGNACWF